MNRLLTLLLALLLALTALPARAGDYFLDGSQKKDLLLYGRITGHDGAQYDIWIVPGYVPPVRQAKAGWSAAGDDLARYGQGKHYRGMVKNTGRAMRFARKDMIGDFALAGSGRAWSSSLATAHQRVQRRVFGWWFAYPWAVLEAGTSTVVRTGIGLPGGVTVFAGAPLVVPAAYLVTPAVMAVGHAGVQGTALPVVAAGWNTLIAPPLALTGQQPAPERADGFWMKRLKDPAEDDIRARLARWQQGMNSEPALAALERAHGEKQKTYQARQQELFRAQRALEAEWQATREAHDAARRARLSALLAERVPELRRELEAAGYTLERLRQQREVLQQTLQAQGMTAEEAVRATERLIGPPDVLEQRQPDSKTDPLRRALEAP